MKLRFSINYRTEWGQQLAIDIRYQCSDGTCRTNHLVMQTQDGDLWQAETAVVESRRSPIVSFTYYYLVEDHEGKKLRREWTLVPRTYASDSSKSYVLPDTWHDHPLPGHLFTNAYAVTMGMKSNETVEALRLPLFRKSIIFRVSAPQLAHGQSLAVIGSHPALGSWNSARFLPMKYIGQKEWMLSVNADGLAFPLEYKYVVIDEGTSQLVQWEEGDNRVAETEDGMSQRADGDVLVLYGSPLRLSEKTWRCAGVSVPVFSLRSEHSYGVGDFGDLRLFVDWAQTTGLKIIQLLPVNDTTRTHQWSDDHPYNITSAFALHPHYISLEQLGPLKDKKTMTAFRRQQRELNALSYSDYEAVDRVKWEYLRLIFEQQGAATLASKEFLEWKAENDEWLEPYLSWLCRENEADIPLHQYVQYHLHLQLKEAAQYARERGIILKGDLPIGVSTDSCETAHHPNLFHLDSQTGTPPDTFTPHGQNWGFPTYNWEAESSDHRVSITQWFKKRLRHQEQYFDALRLDHVLGFFRIWEIPHEQLFGTMGHFSPALPLTSGDIEHFGLPFRKEVLTRPFINDHVIEKFFGMHAQYVRDTFLVKKAYGLYELKPEVDTQQKVNNLFQGHSDENSLWIRDGLYHLVAHVLLLADPHQPDMYHPRIAAWQEPVFDALSSEEREAYLRLYNHYFYQRHNLFWGSIGYQRLTNILRDTRLLICAEDLGMQPACVKPVLDALRILSLEIQHMPRQTGQEFSHLDGNPVRSVATTSTHDMPPLQLWWQENPARAQRFYATMLQKQGHAPEQLPAHLAEEIIARHLYSPSMLCILPLQDWLAMDTELRSKTPRNERINTPSDPYNRWQWRMRITIEQLLLADRFNSKLKTMTARSKRQ